MLGAHLVVPVGLHKDENFFSLPPKRGKCAPCSSRNQTKSRKATYDCHAFLMLHKETLKGGRVVAHLSEKHGTLVRPPSLRVGMKILRMQ